MILHPQNWNLEQSQNIIHWKELPVEVERLQVLGVGVGWFIGYTSIVPGRAGVGSFRRKKNYIAKKEFAYKIRVERGIAPTLFTGRNGP